LSRWALTDVLSAWFHKDDKLLKGSDSE